MYGMPTYDVYSGATMRWPKPQQPPVTVPQVTSRAGAETLAQQLPPGCRDIVDNAYRVIVRTGEQRKQRVVEFLRR